MTTNIDLGGGQSVPRHHLPKAMAAALDQASATLGQTQADIRAWVRPLLAMQAPANFSGEIGCTSAPGLTGRTYALSEAGGAVMVDSRDVPVFAKLGFVAVPSGIAPTTGLRVGLVFMDPSLNEYQRWGGSAWAPVTLT
jgi:hypothetical protein